jgi:hypothetical protein
MALAREADADDYRVLTRSTTSFAGSSLDYAHDFD